MKDRLAISFSGGQSSAVMVHRCLERWSAERDISITFANTGQEHEATYEFVKAVDRNICQPKGHEVVWIEAVIHEPGTGPSARIVDFDSASRDGRPFEDAIKKHGVFGPTHPQCTSRLKTEPMRWYRRNVLEWNKGSYDTAIGIRADEMDRMSSKAKEKRLIYPLVEEGWRKRDVNEWLSQFDWDLDLPNDAFGNCTWCWKKSNRKLYTVAKEDPSVFAFPDRMERQYGHINRGDSEQSEDRVFFRGRRSALDIVREADEVEFEPYRDEMFRQTELWDTVLDASSGGCGSSCEVGADE